MQHASSLGTTPPRVWRQLCSSTKSSTATLKLTSPDPCQYPHAIAHTLYSQVPELIPSNIHSTRDLFASGTCYPPNYISFPTQINSRQYVKRWCMVSPHRQQSSSSNRPICFLFCTYTGNETSLIVVLCLAIS